MSQLWVKVNYQATSSLMRLLTMRYPEDEAIQLLITHYDKAVAEGNANKHICTLEGCLNRTDFNERNTVTMDSNS